MDTIALIKEIFLLVTAFVGLVGTGVGLYFSIKKSVQAAKEKSLAENWNTLMAIADSAMQQAEASTLKGEDKKTMAMNIIKEGAKVAGINADDFLDKLNAYIEQSVNFFNGMKK